MKMDDQYAYTKVMCERNKKRMEKARKSYERRFWTKFGIAAFIVGIILGLLFGCGPVTTTAAGSTASVKEISVNKPVMATEAVTGKNLHVATDSAWHNSSKKHTINVNTILSYSDGAIWNFGNTVAVSGGGSDDHTFTSTVETEYGFTLTVNDDNSVTVHTYNNGQDYIVPALVTADLSTGEKTDNSGKTDYVIGGYVRCNDGFGLVTVEFSNGTYLYAGVLRESKKLYAANVSPMAIAKRMVSYRQNTQTVLDRYGVTPENAIGTDNIYYPIVPLSTKEKKDVAYWVAKSGELTKPDWTNAHKVMAFYNYCVDTFAYDTWSVRQGKNDRCFLYNDYTGKYYISQTHIGICEDFSQVMAIMCRAQGIPAIVAASSNHSWPLIYLADYGRWVPIDITDDLKWEVLGEDITAWTPDTGYRYEHVDNVNLTTTTVYIGNYKDMALNGITN